MTAEGARHPVIVSPFANERVKEWPLRHFRELAEIIVREHGYRVAVVGTRSQRVLANDLVRGLSSEDVLNLCGKLSWAELARAIGTAPYVIANNSGVAHLAAVAGRWTLCLFGGSHATGEWMPRGPLVVTVTMALPCSPCGLGGDRCPNGLVCMAELQPLDVFRRFNEARERTLAAARAADGTGRSAAGRLAAAPHASEQASERSVSSTGPTGSASGDSAPGTAPAPDVPAGPEMTVPIRSDLGSALVLPCEIPADEMRVHDAYGLGAQNRLRADGTIRFNKRACGDVAEPILFFGPYLRIEPGTYSFHLQGELSGSLKLRLTASFTSERLLDTELTSFTKPVLLRLEKPVEKFELIGERTKGTKSMILRSIILNSASPGEDVAQAVSEDDPVGSATRPNIPKERRKRGRSTHSPVWQWLRGG